MYLEQLSLRSFRNYSEVDLAPASEGITLLQGDNGAGKTNLLEAVYYAGQLRSFRGAPAGALVRAGDEQAVIRAAANREGRSLLVEVELSLRGRDKLRLNRQAVRRAEDLASTVLVSVFSPDDIEIVKGGPQARRDFLDELGSNLFPRYSGLRAELERVLRQRNALLRQGGGALGPALDVWDTKLGAVGDEIAALRHAMTEPLSPLVRAGYEALASRSTPDDASAGRNNKVGLRYEQSWEGPLLPALARARGEDLRRGVTTLGPQRDDLVLSIGGFPARYQASQGEQRSLALALRLGEHGLVTERQGSSPVLLLDDIFSELDGARSAALAHCLPRGQALLTAAGPVPRDLPISRAFFVRMGSVEAAGGPPAPERGR